uniref:Uncharacterized protein n=1 Tax=Meloidogyne enterolobii TaxID=390850 RepID=A0A6V7W239_MELEN|nr:unnamed protein product [Meloidogyne enterolobii]
MMRVEELQSIGIVRTKRTVSTSARLVCELSSAAIEESTSMNQRIREHDHTSLPPPKTGVGASETIVLEPYPLQTALIIDMTPRIVAHPPKKEMTSTTTEQTGNRETKK